MTSLHWAHAFRGLSATLSTMDSLRRRTTFRFSENGEEQDRILDEQGERFVLQIYISNPECCQRTGRGHPEATGTK